MSKSKPRLTAMKVLYDSGDVHTAIKKVLTKPRKKDERRVVIVAYIGAGALDFLPSPDGMRIICDLKPGATSAEALEKLRKRRATLEHVPKLHMKVYWSNVNGCVMTSANVSGNALGRGGSLEAGVLLGPGQVDIDRLLASIKPKPILKVDLLRLQHENDVLTAKGVKGPGNSKAEPTTFEEWRETFGRKPWKLGWWADEGEMSQAAVLESIRQYNVAEPYDHVLFWGSQYKPFEWILTFDTRKRNLRPEWVYADFVVPVEKGDPGYMKDYPMEAVQVRRFSRYANPPFNVHDKRFRKALTATVKEFGQDALDELDERKTPTPSAYFMKLLNKHWDASPS